MVVDPSNSAVQNSLGLTRYQQGQREAASACFREAARLAPAIAEHWYNLGTALEAQGDHDDAARAYQEGRRLDPGWPQVADTLARFFLTTPNPQIRCPTEALFRAQQACQATDAKQPELLDTLAAAYAAIGNPAAAVTTAKQALALATARGQKELAQQLEARLHRYEALLAGQRAAP